jgi:hypothetical protein
MSEPLPAALNAQLRMECWKCAIDMAGQNRHSVTVVADLATAAYNFIAGGEKSPPSESRDKSKPTPKR